MVIESFIEGFICALGVVATLGFTFWRGYIEGTKADRTALYEKLRYEHDRENRTAH